MNDTYNVWMGSWLSENRCFETKGYGMCREAAEAMVEAFPELSIVKGHVHCPPPWNKRGHWWCTTSDGTIVDPTASQFPAVFRYEEYIKGDDVLLGRCMNCGKEIWGPISLDGVYSVEVCNEGCGHSLSTLFNGNGD